jgi:hypothetical protein
LVSGDTITGYSKDNILWMHNYENIAIIDSVDSLLINGNYRKRWNYTSNTQGVPLNIFFHGNYIEGIGNSNGLLNGLGSEINYSFSLICFKEKGIPLYWSVGSFNDCSIFTEVKKRNGQQNVKIYPNPFREYIDIYHFNKIKNLLITNIFGQKVYKEDNPSNKIDLSFLEKGTYFMTIATKTEILTQKIIKR